MNDLRSMLMQDEGVRLKPYIDTRGKVTIGTGRCLDTTGITAQEAVYLLDNDILRARAASATFSWFPKLDPVRQDVVAAMVFNVGLEGFCAFKKLIAAVGGGNFDQAASEMLASTWASQVKGRAVRMAEMMKTGAYPA